MVNIQANNAYSLINLKAGTCMDLSGADNQSVIGFGYHQGPNQLWVFENAGDQTFNLKSAGVNKYLSIAGDPSDGQRVVAVDSPFAWRVEDEQGVENGVRLSPANNSNFCIDLSKHGEQTAGTPIQLWSRWEGQNQIWKLQQA